ncbi:hypothetical protein RIF29_19817 [Crotalaria pallida]|uniref:Endonuclease/exonuclease/phosphatase family protein n=1 Tax=Crotalaria pallida TaxID=3830 RepID=A0AAN9F8H2_CROPI
MSKWLDAEANFLLPGISDHSPVLVEWCQSQTNKGADFKFFNMWSSHGDFLSIVDSVWKENCPGNPMVQVTKKLVKLRKPLRQLNKSSFADIIQKESELRARLSFVQELLVQHLSDFSVQVEEKRLHSQYIEVSRAASSFLRQKAKLNLLIGGDDNTAVS